MMLLEMIHEERAPTNELLELIKRIHINGYERARSHFPAALDAEIIVNDVAPGYWRQDALQRILDFAERRDAASE